MKVKIAFALDLDQFFILLENCPSEDAGTQSRFVLIPYDDEDVFIRLVIEAELEEQESARLLTSIIVSVAKPSNHLDWLEFEFTDEQRAIMGLNAFARNLRGMLQSGPDSISLGERVGLDDGIAGGYDFLVQAPTPFFLLSGPELRFTFANDAYIKQLGRPPLEDLLGKTAKEVLSDLKEHRFVDLMQQTMRTGKPCVGKEVRVTRKHPNKDEFRERYVDFIYHPMRNANGQTSGLMVQVEDVTDRVVTRQVNEHREAQLYAQWAELETIYKTAPVGLALFDSHDLRILRMNDEHAQVLGSTADQVRGKTLPNISSSLPEFGNLLLEARQGKTFRNIILTEEPKAHTKVRRSWSVNIAPALGATGQVASISSVFLEVSGQAWPGTGVENPHHLVGDALESMTDCVVVLDRDWNFIYLNSRARTALAMDATLLGRNHWDVFPASIESPLWTHYHRTMHDGVPISCTNLNPTSGRWYEIQTYPAKLGMTIFFRDVTDRKVEELALRHSEERFRITVELASQIPFVMAPGGNLLDLGSRFEDLTGLRCERTIEQGFIGIAHPEDAERVHRAIDQATKRGLSIDVEWRAARRDGDYLWLRSRAAPVEDEDGKVVRYYGSIENIDDWKHMERRLYVAEAALEELRVETGRLVLS